MAHWPASWWLGLPASSSHTLIGSIIGVGVANALMHGRDGTSGVDWAQAIKIGYALLLSPLIGFGFAALLLLALRALGLVAFTLIGCMTALEMGHGMLVASVSGVIRLGRYPCRPTRGLAYGCCEFWVTRLSCSRARDRRERTVPIGMSSTSAVSW